MSLTPSENAPVYVVHETERVEADKQGTFLFINARNPAYAGQWLAGLNRAITALADFPGPLSHARDEEACILFGYEVRRMLYRGPARRASGSAYRVLFTLLPPSPDEGETTILVLRVLHGAQPLLPQTSE